MIVQPAPVVQTADLASYVVELRGRLKVFAPRLPATDPDAHGPRPPATDLDRYVVGLRARLRAFAAGQPLPGAS